MQNKLLAVMEFDQFTKTCSWNFFNPEKREPVVGLTYVRGSQFFPMSTFSTSCTTY